MSQLRRNARQNGCHRQPRRMTWLLREQWHTAEQEQVVEAIPRTLRWVVNEAVFCSAFSVNGRQSGRPRRLFI